MIEVKLMFENAAAASVALAKIGEGERLLAEIGGTGAAAAPAATETGGKGRGRRAAPAAGAAAIVEEDDPLDPKPKPAAAAANGYAARLAAHAKANPGKTPLDFVRDELKLKLVDTFGAEKTREFMASFGHPRVSDVPAEKFPELIAKVDAFVVSQKAA